MFKAIVMALVMAITASSAMACNRDAFVVDDMTYFMSEAGAVVLYGNRVDDGGNIIVKRGMRIHTIINVGSECEFNMLREFVEAGYSANVSVEFTFSSPDTLYHDGVKRCWDEEEEVKCAEYMLSDYEDFNKAVRNLRLK